MSEPLWTDDDVERAAKVLGRHLPDTPSIRRTCRQEAREVLDAVLPAYRKRLLNELANEINETWPDIYLGSRARMWSEAEAWLRAKSEETP